jgi:phage tail-like protein
MPTQYPLVNFKFSLVVPTFTSDVDCGFMEISGFSSKVEGETYKEGGNNTSELFFPTQVKWENLKAKRGVIRGSSMIEWIKTSISTFTFVPQPIVVTLYDAGTAAITWTFLNAYPIGLETSNLDAGSKNTGEILVDTIEFKHGGCIRLDS